MLLCGKEEKQEWRLCLKITPITRKFTGYFRLESIEDAHKRNIRHNDRRWVKRNLPCYRGVYEIHHNWNNAGRMQLLTRQQHLEADAGLIGEVPAKEEGK